MMESIRNELSKRNWWMNLMYVFCLYMTFIYMPFDIFIKPVAEDEEVWFGFLLEGWWAKATAPLHWLIYAGLAWGFHRMAHWMWPWAAVYCAQIAVSMLLWNLVNERDVGWSVSVSLGLVAAAVFLVPTIALWRARPTFQGNIVAEAE